MSKQIPELEEAVKSGDYKKIALISHSIKGSSGNFRLEFLQDITTEMERMAKKQDSEYDYAGMFAIIKRRVANIKIS